MSDLVLYWISILYLFFLSTRLASMNLYLRYTSSNLFITTSAEEFPGSFMKRSTLSCIYIEQSMTTHWPHPLWPHQYSDKVSRDIWIIRMSPHTIPSPCTNHPHHPFSLYQPPTPSLLPVPTTHTIPSPCTTPPPQSATPPTLSV